jgi:hypothetical protein|tara:strand:- start:1711 stop:1956 length:246 start_codon:yes stop_codon:yes gene_type:complete
MGAVKDMLMDVEDFVYGFYDNDGQLTATTPVIVAKAKQKFGISFGEYAKEVLDGPEYDHREAEMEYRSVMSKTKFNDGIPF